MSTIQSRSFSIAMSHSCVLVNLSWFEKDDKGNLAYKIISLEDMTLDECDKVRKVINAMGVNWQISCLKDDRFSVLGDCIECSWGTFDSITESPTPKDEVLELFVVLSEPGMDEFYA